ncbi:two-component system sensor histidine kinase NtrB [Fundidesulfovibrio terrae]|uniref:two-component system sensor histidine kinase NtrB n=1 Tax=Fundidesulfovibrio terrae TaxID=2922866 RepID=UPI001FAEFEB3|nr:PAS domain-containing sensor histidine kinase [Fundidesulfovibrio terrae]
MNKEQAAFSELFSDLVINIMALASNPGKCGEYIATQVRGLIGVRTVFILECSEHSGLDHHRMVASVPLRRRALGETPEIDRLARLSHGLDRATVFRPDGFGEIGDILRELGLGESVVIPLEYTGNRVGVMLLLDLMDTGSIGSILETLDKLGPVLALILRNAALYSGLEKQVDRRTRELSDAYEALRESQERYVLAMQGTNDGIWDWSLRTGEVYFSPRWKEIIGFGPDELENNAEAWKSRIHPDDLDRAMRANMRCADGETPSFEIEYRMRHKDGSYRWVLGRGASLKNEQGEVVRMAGAHTDITERKRMMEAMLQTEKMMSVGGLAAGMAHEINNPLSGILQSAQVLSMRLSNDTPANRAAAAESGCGLGSIQEYCRSRQVFELIASVRDSAGRAARIVQDMLAFCRQGGSGNCPGDVAAILDKALALCASDYDLKKRYDFRHIRIVRDFAPGIPSVPCVEGQLEQVFMNIMRNAAQAMAERLEDAPAPTIVLRTRLEPNNIRVEIEDNGPGMDEKTRRKAFEPFFTTKPPGVGTGLGLSVSYFIITSNHNGTIELESSPGRGARFVIRLPLTHRPRGASAPGRTFSLDDPPKAP